jgi:transcriptional/translational regulatory protein YebC/TACO1
MLVEVLTDNRNRAAADVRNAFTKNGGSRPSRAPCRGSSTARA